MVRTKADGGGRKAVAAKAPRKVLGSNASSGGAGGAMMSPKAGKYAGGNATFERPTPEWQKGINSFFNNMQRNEKENSSPTEEECDMDAEASGASEGCTSSSKADVPSTVAVKTEPSDAGDAEEEDAGDAEEGDAGAAEGEDAGAAGEAATLEPSEEEPSPAVSKPQKRNGIIDSDSDDD